MVQSRAQIPPLLQAAYTRHGHRLPALMEVILVVLIAVSLGQLVWRLIPAPPSARWQAPPAENQAGETGQDVNAQVQRIVSAHLFGQPKATEETQATDLSDAPDTRLNLTLLGILAGSADDGSRALIATSSGEEKPYAVGDNIIRGALLHSIFPDRVILKRAGKLETLRIDRDRPSSASETAYRRPAANRNPNSPAAQLSKVRQTLLADPSKASNYLRVQPANSGGQMRGYRIYPGRDRSVFTAAGLRPGDLVTQVNGIQLNDPSQGLQLLSSIGQASALTVVIERGGQQQTVNINFN